MTPTETTRVREARRADVLEAIRAAFPVEGQKVTVRAAGHGLYSRARRAFGSWQDAVEAAGRTVDETGRGFGGDATELFKNLDAISAHPLPGLPRHLRERQVLGGMMLERFAKQAIARGDALTAIAGLGPDELGDYSRHNDDLADAFLWALRRYRLLTIKPDRAVLTELVAAAGDGETIAVSQQYDGATGDLELEDRPPIEHADA